MAAYSFTPNIEGQLCDRLRTVLAGGDYDGVLVSTEYPQQNIPSALIWVTKTGGTSRSWGEQEIIFSIRCIADDYDAADDLAAQVRSFLDDIENTVLEPITAVVTTAPIPTALFESQNKTTMFFTATMHEVATLN